MISLHAENLAQHVPGWEVSSQLVEQNGVSGCLVQMRQKCMVCMKMHEFKGMLFDVRGGAEFIRLMKLSAREHEKHGMRQ